MLKGDPSSIRTGVVEQIKGFVTTNSGAFALARTGLTRQSRIPIEYSEAYFTRHTPELMAVKRIAVGLALEGKLAEVEGRFGDAAKIYLQIIHLGHEAARGGFVIDFLVATASEAQGEIPLQKLAPNLSAEECRQTIARLEELETSREPLENIIKEERTFCRSQIFNWKGFKDYLGDIVSKKSFDPAKEAVQSARKRSNKQLLRILNLKVSLAARAYESEKSRKPKHLDDLVPIYLKTVPISPVTRTNLNYNFEEGLPEPFLERNPP